MKKILTLALLSAIASSGAIATSANAATLIVDGNGKLTGATGVTIGTKKYNVAFKDGTCAQVYGTCATSSFDFTTRDDAIAASQALLDQVFIDGPAGTFDSNPGLTFGCSETTCISYIATDSVGPDSVRTISARNTLNVDFLTGTTISSFRDTAAFDGANYARFTLVPDVSAVPEPASWAMMIGGLGMLGGTMRRRKTRVAFA